MKDTVNYTAFEKVGYADVAGFSAVTGKTVQTTGPGKALGIGPGYRKSFPKEIRRLTGSKRGVLVFQQTAANLRVKEGDSVTIKRFGLPPVSVKVNGIVDLPCADSLFQAIGIIPGAAPQAPPDNVILLPVGKWHKIFDPQKKVRPDTVRTQFHIRITHNLPPNPVSAYTYVKRLANNLEVKFAGSGIVGNNIAARLSAVREDALYARILFLFLGFPGAVVAILLTLFIAASGEKHRMREQALLRTRGSSVRQVLKFESVESFIAGAAGVILGIALAWPAERIISPLSATTGRVNLFWLMGACAAGFVLAAAAVMYPAWRLARFNTVSSSRMEARPRGQSFWKKLGIDFIFLALAGAVYVITARKGYSVVLAPEGVSQVSVHYEAFIAPLFFWIGGVLFAVRLLENLLDKHRRAAAFFLKPVAGNLSGIVASSIARQRRLLARGAVLVALAVSFAVSTAVFNTTYNAQSRVDARLTNGSDVTVTGLTKFPPGIKLQDLKNLPGVTAAQTMTHRFAYVGCDLQDIYGIDPLHIGEAADMSNAYFAGGNAAAALAQLVKNPDGVLVSEETRRDFRLAPGDRINIRLQFAGDGKYHVVPFKFIGVVREFPTAPKDSFLVANASYIAEKTGINAREIVLMRTSGNPVNIAAAARKVVSTIPGARVSDIGSTQRIISSSLTSVNLRGLTRLELIFAVGLVMAATGLILALGLDERRRNFAVLIAIGAKSRQLSAFIWSEGALVLASGSAVGAALGLGIAHILIKVLTGVFDPPPEHMYIPWEYITVLATSAVISTVIAVLVMKKISLRSVTEELRNI